MYAPKLIPLFLPKFYNMKDFKIQDFDEKRLEKFYFFQPKHNSRILQSLSEKLSSIKAKMNNSPGQFLKDYCNVLYSFLNVLRPNSVYKFYKVRIRMDVKQFQDKVYLHEIKLMSVEYVTTLSNISDFIWTRETAFVRKLKYNDLMTRSLTKFENKT